MKNPIFPFFFAAADVFAAYADKARCNRKFWGFILSVAIGFFELTKRYDRNSFFWIAVFLLFACFVKSRRQRQS